jgi:hypothetical protein
MSNIQSKSKAIRKTRNSSGEIVLQPFRLVATVLERSKELPEGLLFLPPCSVCGRVITDFDRANLVVRSRDDEHQRLIFTSPNFSLSELVGAEVFAVHDDCDPGFTPWKKLSTILRSNQAYEWEQPTIPEPNKVGRNK